METKQEMKEVMHYEKRVLAVKDEAQNSIKDLFDLMDVMTPEQKLDLYNLIAVFIVDNNLDSRTRENLRERKQK